MTFEEYREEILSALGLTDDVNIRNFADFREAVLTKLGVEFTEEDLRNEEHFRLKFLEGLQGGGGLKTKTINLYEEYENIKTLIDSLSESSITTVIFTVTVNALLTTSFYIDISGIEPYKSNSGYSRDMVRFCGTYDNSNVNLTSINISSWGVDKNSRPIITIPDDWEITSITTSVK